MSRTAIIDADGTLLRVVFTSDLPGEDTKGVSTIDCPDDFPKLVDWDAKTRSWVAADPPPPPPAPKFDQLLDILATGKFPDAAQIAALKKLPL